MPHAIEIPTSSPRPANRRRFTESDCLFLERSGLIRGNYELIQGDILDKMPQKNNHRIAVIRLIVWLTTVFTPDLVGTQATVRIDSSNMPEPDGFILDNTLSSGQSYPEPANVVFVIEVSDSTLADDLGAKARLYAEAGIAEYWVIDIVSRRLIAHRLPSEDGYQQIFGCLEDESLAPLARPESAVLVSSLLPPELVA